MESFNWVIPKILSDSCKIRISDYNNSEVMRENTGLFSIANPVSVDSENELPTEYMLYPNYPNPFNPVTTITYDLPSPGFVSLKVYDALGKEVTILVNTEKNAGKHQIEFNASRLSNGLYIYSLRSKEFSQSRKMILLK